MKTVVSNFAGLTVLLFAAISVSKSLVTSVALVIGCALVLMHLDKNDPV